MRDSQNWTDVKREGDSERGGHALMKTVFFPPSISGFRGKLSNLGLKVERKQVRKSTSQIILVS